jgi:thymidine kinase
VLIHPDTNLFDLELQSKRPADISCVLVDEAQFLAPKHIDQLRAITNLWNVPVICYGLRTDFRTHLFPGSRRLMEVADTIEEVKTTCQICNRKAVFNLKHVNGKADISGPVIQLGAEEKYFPACFTCYRDSLKEAGQYVPDWEPNAEELLHKQHKGESDSDESVLSVTSNEDTDSSELDNSR